MPESDAITAPSSALGPRALEERFRRNGKELSWIGGAVGAEHGIEPHCSGSPQSSELRAHHSRPCEILCVGLERGCTVGVLVLEIELMSKFVENDVLPIGGIGRGTWETLLENRRLDGLLDWLALDETQLADLPGFGERSARQLAEAFRTARQRSFAVWLRALGLPPAGDARLPSSWDELAGRSLEQWQDEPGVGPGRARRLQAFFSHPELQTLRERLQAAGVEGF